MHHTERSRTTRLHNGPRGIPKEPVEEAQIQPEEEVREINLGVKLGSQKPVFISS